MNKYEIHFKFNEDNEQPEGYSIFFNSTHIATTKEDIIALAKTQNELDENDLADLKFIDYAIKLDKEDA